MSAIEPIIAALKEPGLSQQQRFTQYVRLGDALVANGQLDRGAKAFSKALALEPTSHPVYYSLGVALGRAQHLEQAYSAFGHVVALAPLHAAAHRAHALSASMLGRPHEAATMLQRAVRADPKYEDAHFELGVALQQSHELAKALAQYDRLLALAPGHAGGHANRGTVLKDLGRPSDASDAYTRALRLKPRFGEVYNNLAVLCAGDLRQPERALRLIAIGRSLEASSPLEWDSASGLALSQLRKLGEAAEAYAAAYRTNPSAADSSCSLLLARMRIAHWKDADALGRDTRRHLLMRGCQRTWDPLYGLAVPEMSPALLMTLSARIAQRKLALATTARAALAAAPWPPLASTVRLGSDGGRGSLLRVGYLSADYRWHVMGFLTIGLLSEHANGFGRTQFDVHALSLAADDGTGWQPRFRRAVDGSSRSGHTSRFIDLSRPPASSSAASLAREIRSLKLHILIDLNGYTTDERAEALALEPAPLLMHAIGYPGTLGASYVPYMLVDKHALPPHLGRVAMSERLVYQPHAYQANDHARTALRAARAADDTATAATTTATAATAAATATAAAATAAATATAARPLDASTLWLVNFNQLYKVSPSAGRLWCGLLRRVPAAKLWLLLQPADGEPHVGAELNACGIHAARRARFAPLEADVGRHLQRTRAASLLIDTVEYGCHTTASDALWGGVPMVTTGGAAMAARVGMSLMRADGAGEGVVASAKEYADVAAALLRRRP